VSGKNNSSGMVSAEKKLNGLFSWKTITPVISNLFSF